MADVERKLDFRVQPSTEIEESDLSLAARRAAERFGAVETSSYSTFEGRPVLWAFDVENGGRKMILAGGEGFDRRVILFVEPEFSFTGMLYGKAIVARSRDPLEPHQMTQLHEVPSEAGWFCDSFYVSRARADGMRDQDVVAVALHASDVGLSPDVAEAAVARRSPELLSTPDPDAALAGFPQWVQLVRCLRRLSRLRELCAPEIMIESDVERATRLWRHPEVRAIARWPADLLELARELRLLNE